MITQTVSTTPRLIPSTRFTLALLLSAALFVHYAQRVSLSMGIVCMVNRTNINTALNSTSVTTTKYGSQFLKEKQLFLTEFQQQIIFAANWLGYTLTLVSGT
jgi:hypothetical protein